MMWWLLAVPLVAWLVVLLMTLRDGEADWRIANYEQLGAVHQLVVARHIVQHVSDHEAVYAERVMAVGWRLAFAWWVRGGLQRKLRLKMLSADTQPAVLLGLPSGLGATWMNRCFFRAAQQCDVLYVPPTCATPLSLQKVLSC